MVRHGVPDTTGPHAPLEDKFWSCCNSYAVPSSRLRSRPRQLYQDVFDLAIKPDVTDFLLSRCLEFKAWAMW